MFEELCTLLANAAQLCSTGHERSQEGAEVNKFMPHGHAARR